MNVYYGSASPSHGGQRSRVNSRDKQISRGPGTRLAMTESGGMKLPLFKTSYFIYIMMFTVSYLLLPYPQSCIARLRTRY